MRAVCHTHSRRVVTISLAKLNRWIWSHSGSACAGTYGDPTASARGRIRGHIRGPVRNAPPSGATTAQATPHTGGSQANPDSRGHTRVKTAAASTTENLRTTDESTNHGRPIVMGNDSSRRHWWFSPSLHPDLTRRASTWQHAAHVDHHRFRRRPCRTRPAFGINSGHREPVSVAAQSTIEKSRERSTVRLGFCLRQS